MITLLRLGHRLPRDCRITTHVALTARAFGATAFYYTGQRDKGFEQALASVVDQFGGTFTLTYCTNGISLVTQKKKEGFTIIHLTMYGLRFTDVSQEFFHKKNLLLIIGSEKVPPAYYHLADFNVSITEQPLSEVSALGIFLYAYSGFPSSFSDAKVQVVPSARGKTLKEIKL